MGRLLVVFLLFQTATHEDVIFVSEKVGNPVKIVIDQVQRLALQRDIDQASKEPSRSLVGRGFKYTKNMVVEENIENKKGMAQLEQQQDDTPLKKEKKKKKEKTSVRAEEVSADVDVEGQVKKKGNKKRTADPVMTSESHDTEMKGDDGRSSKKKKKTRLENNNPVETEEHLKVSRSTVKEGKENGQSKKKQKKTSSQPVLEEDHVNVESKVKEESVVEEKAVGQKSMKKKKAKAEGNMADAQNEVSNGNGEEGLKRKTKKRPAVAVGESGKTNVSVKGEAEDGVMKKKKEKVCVEITTESNMEVENTQKVKKSSKKRKGGQTPNDTEPEVEEGERKKEKKRKAASAKEEEEEAVEVSPKKKGKRKSKSDGAEEERATEGSAGRKKGKKSCAAETEVERSVGPADQTSESTPGKRTAQHRNTKTEKEDAPVTKAKRKKKIKEEPQTCDDQGTVVFLSEKTGNADEVNIDQDRRLALQREIDQESQPKRPAAQAGLGQWSTAQFDNANQQQKFLRLMGGFKKGAQPMVAGAGRANMALGKEEQQKLQQGLQGEFERAQARRMDFNAKGLGLGFSAPSNKKFSIDVNACKSVRFDD